MYVAHNKDSNLILEINSSSDFSLEDAIRSPPMINKNPIISSTTLFSVIEKKKTLSKIGCDAIAKTLRFKKLSSDSTLT
jgi:hypothetical protein